MVGATLVLGLMGCAILSIPLALHVSVEIAGPFTAPLGGGLCVTALVLSAVTLAAQRRRRLASGRAWTAMAIALAGLAGSMVIESTLIRRARSQAARDAAGTDSARRALDEKRFEDDLKENLNK